MIVVVKRNKEEENFNFTKIETAIKAACNYEDCKEVLVENDTLRTLYKSLFDIISKSAKDNKITVEEIQDIVETKLLYTLPRVARHYIKYRDKQSETRFIEERLEYIDKYSNSTENAASSSETDANANVSLKNIATQEGEVYKTKNRELQRATMKNQLNKIYPEVAKQYIKDVEHHIIYPNDEASSPVIKPYCMAASLYTLMTDGVGNIDGVTPSAPNDLQSFSGQITNLVFLLSSQCKGAVALSEYFVALNYYVIQEFGSSWYNKLDCVISSEHCVKQKTIRNAIEKAFKQFVWGINQPSGNRNFQSPFVNISYFDNVYFNALFGNFCYPDSTSPAWKAVSTLQKMFIKWFNKLRLIQVVAFPVETYAMIYDDNGIKDKEYREFWAEMLAEGHSFFTFISRTPDAIASCCRLRNKITFNPTSGLTGVMTGSCNVITLNINRIVQDWAKITSTHEDLKEYIIDILERVYKYHIAFKTKLYDLEDKGMLAASNGGYIYMNKLYSTIGINGLNEAAEFLGFTVSNNEDYIKFLQFILKTIKDQNEIHSIHDKDRPFIFNSEVVPAESLGGKNYNWDKEDGYVVPKDRNLYNSYFYNAHDDTSVLDKMVLHGNKTYQYTDGGSACHINLEDHLSKKQYLKLLDFAVEQGTSYFTFNIPNSKCEDCGFIIKKPVNKCPKCGSTNITQYTRIIGYIRAIKNFGKDRIIEAGRRIYSKITSIK